MKKKTKPPTKAARRKAANQILKVRMDKHIERYSGVGKVKFKPDALTIQPVQPGSAAWDRIQAHCSPKPDYLSHCLKSLSEPVEYVPELPVEKPPHEPS